MAFTEFYAQAGGSVMNGGSDQNNAAAYTCTNSNWDGTSVYTPTDGSTPANTVTVGMFASVYLDGATVPVYHARVTVVAAGVNGAITLSTTAKDGTAPTSGATGRTLKAGGAWGLPSAATTFPLLPLASFANMTNAAGNLPRINCQCSGTGAIDCAMTSGITNNVSGAYVIQGYKTSVGDGETNTDTQANQVNYKLRIDGSTNAIALYTLSGNTVRLADLQFSNNGTTGSNNGVTITGARNEVYRLIVHDVRGIGIQCNAGQLSLVHECELYACNGSNTAGNAAITTAGSGGVTVFRCYIHDNVGSNTNGISGTNPLQAISCIFDGNAQHGIFSQGSGQGMFQVSQCDFYNNGADGIRCASSSGVASTFIERCTFEANGQSTGTGYGVNVSGILTQFVKMQTCAYFNNKTGQTNGSGIEETGAITLGATAYNAASTGDFRPLGAGASSVKGAGRSRFVQTGSSKTGTLGYYDAVAAQHQDAGGQNRAILPSGLSALG